MKHPIVVVGGGTGGHLYPAMSLYVALLERQLPVLLVTDQRGEELCKQNIHNRLTLLLRRKPFLRFILDMFRNALRCFRLFCGNRPLAVVSFGGYTAFIPMLVAQFLRIPTFIHEQNAVLGRTHRFSARFVKAIATSFPIVQKLPNCVPVVYFGNPVRAQIAALFNVPYAVFPAEHPFNLLVIGGSQGARVFSEVVPEAIARLNDAERSRMRVVQQCRPENSEETIARYEQLGIHAEVKPFFEDMAACYRQANLVITRSGASTLAELEVAGLPCVLVPYPFAMDSHQQVNAEQLSQAGAAWMLLEQDFEPESLARVLQCALKDTSLLKEKSKKIRAFARPDATQELANFIASFVGKRHK